MSYPSTVFVQNFQERTKIVSQARRFQSYILNNQIDMRKTCAQLCDPNISQSLLPNFTNGAIPHLEELFLYLKDVDTFVSNGHTAFTIGQHDDLFATVSSNMILVSKCLSQLHPMLEECFGNLCMHLKTVVIIEPHTLAGHTMVLKKPKHATAGYLFLASDALKVKVITSRKGTRNAQICKGGDAMVFKSDLSGRAHVHVDVPILNITKSNDRAYVILFMWFFPANNSIPIPANTMKTWAVDPIILSGSSSSNSSTSSTSSTTSNSSTSTSTSSSISGILKCNKEQKQHKEQKHQEPKTVFVTDDTVAEHLLAVSTRRDQIKAMQTDMKKAETYITQQQQMYDAIVSSESIKAGFCASHKARDDLKTEGKDTSSFQYGEIKFYTVAKALSKLKIKYGGWKNMNQDGGGGGGGVFYDLGSGCGNVCIAAALFHPWKTVTGIEILVPLHEIAIKSVSRYYSQQDSNDPTPIEIKHGNFLIDTKWYKDANVVFCNSLAFEDDLLDALCDLLRELESGTFLLHSGRLNSNNRLEKDFVCLEFSNMEFSWGTSTMWIYQRQ